MRYFLLVLIVLLISSCSYRLKTDHSGVNKIDTSKITKDKPDDFQNKILEANNRFNISDKKALEMLLKIKEINDIKNWNYNDTITSNNLILIGIPDNSDQRWQYDMGQFQKGVDKYYTLSHFWINATTGRIQVLESDANVDSLIDLKDWINRKINNK